jgi:hypothetical protein
VRKYLQESALDPETASPVAQNLQNNGALAESLEEGQLLLPIAEEHNLQYF